MAENHPVGFQYVIEARLRSAKVIHVDPRYSRTSAMCNLHVPIRAGTDIALLGGIINYILENNRYFKEYVKRYTNAPVIINEEFADTHGKLQRLALPNLDWLVVRDLQEIETAAFWYDSPEIETGELETKRIGTEVFFMPAASHVEKSGTFTNTQRLLQWREQAVEPRADCRSELWFMYHLGRKVREKLASSTDPRDHPRPDLGLPHGGAVRRPLCRGGTARDQRLGRERRRPAQLHLAQARRLDRLRMLDLLRLLRQRDEPDRSPQAPGPSRLGSPPSGAGPGHSTAVSSTTVPPQTPKASRGPRGRNTSGEMRRTSGGPATTSPTSR
jgi:anaerobic selenocysteine-containing dehydrogenase